MLDRYLDELRSQEVSTEISPGEMAKTAGVRVPDSLCNACGGEMTKLGTTMRCDCGFIKMAQPPMGGMGGPPSMGGMPSMGGGGGQVPMGPAPMPPLPSPGGTGGAGGGIQPMPKPGEPGSIEDRALKLIEKGMASGADILKNKGELSPEHAQAPGGGPTTPPAGGQGGGQAAAAPAEMPKMAAGGLTGLALRYGPEAAGALGGGYAGYQSAPDATTTEQVLRGLGGAAAGAVGGHLVGRAAQGKATQLLAGRAAGKSEKVLGQVAGVAKGKVGPGDFQQTVRSALGARADIVPGAALAGVATGGPTGYYAGKLMASPKEKTAFHTGLPHPGGGSPQMNAQDAIAKPPAYTPMEDPKLDPQELHQRMAENEPALEQYRRQTGMEADLSPAGALMGGVTGAAAGSEIGKSVGGTAGQVAGGAIGGILGLVGGSEIGDLLSRIIQTRREAGERAATTPAGQDAIKQGEAKHAGVQQSLLHLRKRLKEIKGIERSTDEFGRSVIDVPISHGIPFLSATSSLPVGPTRPGMRIDLAPSLGLSPTIGASRTGLQVGVRMKRRPKGVPANSVVGKGLDTQRPERGSEAILPITETMTTSGGPGQKTAAVGRPVLVQQSPLMTRAVFENPEYEAATGTGELLGTLGGAAGGAALGRRYGGRVGTLAGAALGAVGGRQLGGLGAEELAGAADIPEHQQIARLTPLGQRLQMMRMRMRGG